MCQGLESEDPSSRVERLVMTSLVISIEDGSGRA